ncbi:MAG: pirin family protein, partial [Frankiales bacterium]|nr:pirin family protein [Frankiales bacterium]
MSGPVEAGDVAGTVEPPASAIDAAGSAPVGEGPPRVEVTDGREATVGHLTVRRVLPRRPRRTVGAWCFADQMGPIEVRTEHAVDIGPHPHIGLHTVTWLLAGELLHRDTLGSEQPIRPGQLNLMTAGAGVAHAEEQVGYRGGMHGMQLWVAQPSSTRHGHPAFEHHAELPQTEVGGSRVTVLVGEFDGTASPARRDTELVGLDAVLDTGPVEWPVRADFEHALIVLEGRVEVDGVA